MTLLSADVIRELMQSENPLVYPVEEDRCKWIEGSAFDITVDDVFCIDNTSELPLIGAEARRTPAVIPMPAFQVNKGPVTWRLSTWGYYLLRSVETLVVPENVSAIIRPRTTLFRTGAILACSVAHPGYHGKIICGLYVAGGQGFHLEKGARFASVHWHTFTEGKTDLYGGVWGGDKVSTDGKVERGY